MSFVKIIMKTVTLPILYGLYILSCFIPKKKELWLFGSSNNTFTDNAKYFYLYVAKSHPNIQAIWITSSQKVIDELYKEKLKVYKRWSLLGIYYALRAKVYIYNTYTSDINHWTSCGAIKFNLWHGIPMKKIQYDITVGDLGKVYNSKYTLFYKILFPNWFQKPDYLLSTSTQISQIFASAFKIDIAKCLEFGYPRCDHFMYKESDLVNFLQVNFKSKDLSIDKLLSYDKIIIYMPTFREQSTNDILEILDIEDLNRRCRKNNTYFIIKQHPNIKKIYTNSLSNILFLNSSIDIQLILPFSNVLITDYSSVAFDYLLLSKPVIYYAYDKKKYIKKERGFYIDYDQLVKNNIVETYTELCEMLFFETRSIPKKFNKEYFWNGYNGKSSEKIFKFIREIT